MTAKEFLDTDFNWEDGYPLQDQDNWDSYSPEQLEWLLNNYAKNKLIEKSEEIRKTMNEVAPLKRENADIRMAYQICISELLKK